MIGELFNGGETMGVEFGEVLGGGIDVDLESCLMGQLGCGMQRRAAFRLVRVRGQADACWLVGWFFQLEPETRCFLLVRAGVRE